MFSVMFSVWFSMCCARPLFMDGEALSVHVCHYFVKPSYDLPVGFPIGLDITRKVVGTMGEARKNRKQFD